MAKLAILCSGQGTQHQAMSRMLAGDTIAEEVFAEVCRALQFDPRATLGNAALRYRNVTAQPLFCAHALATWRAIARHVPSPSMFAGYSVGELAAYACAGSITAAEVALLAQARARRMDAFANRSQGLLSLRGAPQDIDALVHGEEAFLAIEISPSSRIYGAEATILDRLVSRANGMRVAASVLRVEIAAHTPLLSAAVPGFRSDLQASQLTPPSIAVMAGIDAKPVSTRERAIDTLARQVAEPIRWGACVEALVERGCRVFLELGPGRALATQVRQLFPHAKARAIEEFSSLQSATAWVSREAGVP